MRRIYLDNHSTTPVDPEVFEAIKPYFIEKPGNAASQSHSFGWEAEEAVKQARESIARSIGAQKKETIIFTSGATESNNLAIKGIAKASHKQPAHFITQKTEHRSVLDSFGELEKEGHQVTYLSVDTNGFVNPKDIQKSLKENTILCSIMYANNEIGTLQPISEISKICHEQGILLHSDAVQALGKIPVDVKKEGIDLMSLSAHKMYGPKGIGALYIADTYPPISLKPLLHGGGHERGLRSGTLNVPGIVGLAKALEISLEKMPEESKRLKVLRDYLVDEILRQLDQVKLNGPLDKRLPHNANLSFEYVEAESLMMAIPEIALSSGSACASGTTEPSYVLRAIGLTDDLVLSSLRFGLGRFTNKEEIDYTIQRITETVKKLRQKSLKQEMAKK